MSSGQGCASCGIALGPSPLYSPDGTLVCDSCHVRLADLDRHVATARYLAWSSLVAGGIGSVLNPYFTISTAAVLAGLGGIRVARGLRAAGHNAGRQLVLKSALGAALGSTMTALSIHEVVSRVQKIEPRSALALASDESERTGNTQGKQEAFATACGHGDPKACRLLGEYLSAEGDHNSARAPLERACELKSGSACYLLANLHDSNAFGTVDQARAIELYERACRLKQGEACIAAKSLAEQVSLEAFPKDADGSMLRRLVEAGSDLTRPHEADFFVYFTTEKAARAAGRTLEREGFKVKVERADKDKKWLCIASKSLVPEHAALAALRVQLTALATDHGGNYDGWETSPVR